MLHMLLVAALCASVLVLVVLIAVIVLFARRPGQNPAPKPPPLPEDPEGDAAAAPSAGEGGGSYFRYQDGAGTPPVFTAAPPARPRGNAAAVAAVLAVALCASLACNIGLWLYAGEQSGRARAASLISDDYEGMNMRVGELEEQLGTARSQYQDQARQYERLQAEYDKLSDDAWTIYDGLMQYYGAVALLNEWEATYQLYHTLSCPRLNESFYVYGVNDAENTLHCSPCPDCH